MQLRVAVAYKALAALSRLDPPLAFLVDYATAQPRGEQLDSASFQCDGLSRMRDGTVSIYTPNASVLARVLAHVTAPPKEYPGRAPPSFEAMTARLRVSAVEAGVAPGMGTSRVRSSPPEE